MKQVCNRFDTDIEIFKSILKTVNIDYNYDFLFTQQKYYVKEGMLTYVP